MRTHLCWLALLSCLLATNVPVFALAQEPAEPVVEAPPAPPEERPADSLFWHIVRSAGWFFGPLLLVVSVGLVALIALLAMDLRLPACVPPAFVEDFTDSINQRHFKEAFDLARADGSYLARVMTVGMSRLQYGLEDAREAAVNTVESIRAGKEQLITYLATIGTLGPLLGLVGTVFGMILSFMELGRAGRPPNPAKLAEGISHALVVTLLGIALAVPAIFAHAFFRNRLIRIAMDVSNLADDLLTQMFHSSKRPAPPSPTEVRPLAPTSASTKPAP